MQRFGSLDERSYLEYRGTCRNSFPPNWKSPSNSWPLEKMAHWGMRHIKDPVKEDKMQCDYCLMITYDWKEGDDLKEGHLRECPFMRWCAGRPSTLATTSDTEPAPMETDNVPYHPHPAVAQISALEQQRAQEMEEAQLYDEWVLYRKCAITACRHNRCLLFIPCTHLVYCRVHGDDLNQCDHPRGTTDECKKFIQEKIVTHF